MERASCWRGGSADRQKLSSWAKVVKIWGGLTGVQPRPGTAVPAAGAKVAPCAAAVHLARPRANWLGSLRSCWPKWLRGWKVVAVALLLLLTVPRLLATLAGIGSGLLVRALNAANWHFSYQVGGERTLLAKDAIMSLWTVDLCSDMDCPKPLALWPVDTCSFPKQDLPWLSGLVDL